MSKKNSKKITTNSDSDDNIFVSEKSASEKSISGNSVTDISEDSDNNSITFIKLEDNSKTEIKYIYHISDIHIRNTQRHAEYKEVFERTYQKLKSQIGTNNKISLIVLTGDIMHTKTELSPESFSIAQDFFKALSEITAVILIPGNHDCNLSNKDRLDALTPIVTGNVKIDNLYYLKKSGIYQYYNIIFGITSIFDDVLVNANKINNEIWKSITQKKKYKIALYHGPVHGAKTDVGYRMNNEQLLAEDFDGYDYVMLGDIHKFQYMNEKETIAYAGSLIQQSYGENLSGHGILKWNLFDGESELLEIRNDYGYCTVRIVDGKIIDTKIPRKPRVRFMLENTNQIQYQEVLNNLEKEYQICEIVKDSNFRTKKHVNSPQSKIKTEVTAYATQEEIIKSYLKKKGLGNDKIMPIIGLHKKMYQKVLEEKKDQIVNTMHNSIKTQKWKILELKFTNTLSYGKDNIIDFRKYDPNKIIGIVAPNHYGKSAILDIILFCLFDKFSRGDRRDILNKNEKNMYCSLLFSIGSQKYLIERIGERSKNGLTVKIDVNFFRITEEKVKEKLNGIDKNETNKKIIELIGDYNDYLTTCFCLQQGKSSNFIDMTQQQKKEYLNEILKLNVFEDCYNLAKDKLKKLSGQLKLLEQQVGTKSLDDIKKNIKNVTTEITRLESQNNNITKALKEELDYILFTLSQTTLTTFNELSNYDLSSEKKISEAINNIKNDLSINSGINTEKIKHELKLTNEKIKETENKDQCERDQFIESNVIHDKEELLKKIVGIPKNMENVDIKFIKKEKLDAETRIKNINELIDSKQNQNLNDKLDRINELKNIISNLRKSLKITLPEPEKKISELKEQLIKNENLLFSLTNCSLEQFNTLNDSQKEMLLQRQKTKEIFDCHVENTINLLKKYKKGFSKENDEIIDSVLELNYNWHKDYQNWCNKVNKLISNDNVNVQNIFDESKRITKEMIGASSNALIIYDNNVIHDKINVAEKELRELSEFSGTKKEIDNLEQEKKILEEKINMYGNKIAEYDEYQKSLILNEKILKKIAKFQNIIDSYTNEEKNRSIEIKNLKKIASSLTETLNKHKEKNKKTKTLTLHLKLLQDYKIIYMNWYQKNEYFNKWTKIKKEFDADIENNRREIDKKKMELVTYKKDIEQYLEHRKDFDDKSIETNLYQLYVQVMNYNGLPYEILKTYLPLIESDVNQILHSMVNFNIEFMFYDEEQLEEQKKKQLKTNMGCVNVNICYQDMKPYNVQLASGFEKFIIGLAIRMTLCQISLTAKPNFFIIDEGWSCLDSENLGNISTIMNYIKTQYEHIIVISHLEELKNQADYVINIEKKNGHSHIRTENKLIIKRKKNKAIII
jgi:DNA repair exonuclease SbcCD ATPase subunit